jgi:dTDP-4-dehydrorhamnose reductase
MKVLLIGKTCQLGSSLLANVGAHQCFSLSRLELDIESIESYREAIRKHQPYIIIYTDAFYNVILCEI